MGNLREPPGLEAYGPDDLSRALEDVQDLPPDDPWRLEVEKACREEAESGVAGWE